MKNVFRWLQMGFTLHDRNNNLVDDLRAVKPFIDSNQLPEMFANGYYFYNPVHHVKVSNMDDYNTYFVKSE